MKQIFLLFTACLICSCITVESEEGLETEISGQTYLSTGLSFWRYEVEITHKGTKSEGKIGHLFYKNEEIPGCFNIIITGNKKYIYHFREFLWGFGGYKLEDNYKNSDPFTEIQISKEELEKGWYISGLEGEKRDTPGTWVWVKRDNTAGYVNPQMLNRFIESYGFSLIGPPVFPVKKTGK